MKNTIVKVAVSALLMAAIVMPALAAEKHPMDIHNRLQRQHARIAAGRHNGTMTAGQARAVRQRDRAIHARAVADRVHTGHLNAGQRARLQHRLNNTSRTIHNEKHPAM